METSEAVKFINGVTLMPGWSVTATDAYPLPGTVHITCMVDTVNSNRDMALRNYPQNLTIAPDALIDVARIADAEQLYYELFGWVLSLMEHELREFFRGGATLRAPFHPHRPEGNAAYERQATRMFEEMMAAH